MNPSYVQMIPMAIFDTAGLSGLYQSLNGAGLAEDIKVFKIFNSSNVGITISLDGVVDHDFWPATNGFIIDFQSNHSCNSSFSSGTFNVKAGQIFYGKGTAGIGNLYIMGYR